MTYQIGEFIDGQQVTRDATPEEIAEIEARATALPTQDQYVVAIQQMLDTVAQERRYYGIISACTYGNSTNPTFQAEAQACIAWRDTVWTEAYDLLAQVQAGTLAQPSIAGLLAQLPAMVWPT